jgi:hypothetical protein
MVGMITNAAVLCSGSINIKRQSTTKGKTMKYIHFLQCGFIIFPVSIEHAVMARKFDHDDVLSAGFVGTNYEGVYCYGKSHSLGKESNRADTCILREFLNTRH